MKGLVGVGDVKEADRQTEAGKKQEEEEKKDRQER